jgi:hypothetical protein
MSGENWLPHGRSNELTFTNGLIFFVEARPRCVDGMGESGGAAERAIS